MYNDLILHLTEKYPLRTLWNVETIFNESIAFEKKIHNNLSLQFLITGYDINNNPRVFIVCGGDHEWHVDFTKTKSVAIGDMNCKYHIDKEEKELKPVLQSMVNEIYRTSQTNPYVNNKPVPLILLYKNI